MKEWLEALKNGTALRFLDAVDPLPGTRGSAARGVLGTSADGAWVLVRGTREVRAWNPELGEWRLLADVWQPVAACFAAGLVIIASRSGLAAVDLEGNTVWSERPEPETSDAPLRMCVDAEGSLVVAHALGSVRWLNPTTGIQRRRLALDKRSGTLREFDGETGRSDGREYEAVYHEEILGFDPGGRYALAWLAKLYNGPHQPGDLRLRDFASGSCTAVADGILHPGTTQLGPGARWAIAWRSWAAVALWDLVAKKNLGFRPARGTSVGLASWGPHAAMSPDGRHWVSAVEREICLWETSAESPIDRIDMPSYPSIDGPLAFSPDGRRLYLCLEGLLVRLGVDPDVAGSTRG